MSALAAPMHSGPANRAPMHSRRDRAAAWIKILHERTTTLFSQLDRGGTFSEDRWLRSGGGGGVTRILAEGKTFEKVGVNRSLVDGVLPAAVASRLGGRVDAGEESKFFATGLSVVAHPRSPHIPTVHLNVRYFELTDDAGELRDAWFGGGTDLTPTYPSPDDARAFHRSLRVTCDAHHASLYPRFKSWCDDYFRNTHRGGEARGVGGIFFDHLRPDEDSSALDDDALFAFVGEVGSSLQTAYAPIVEQRRDHTTTAAERSLQLTRRARYAEFNLLHDRGTLFGLQTGARVESVLMSLPPMAQWTYAAEGSTDPLSAALTAMLVPRDWASEDD
ncbi:MAG: oxygen-dependent coproporphyrinogen oxidase [Gemmatimonadaceae bacterium]